MADVESKSSSTHTSTSKTVGDHQVDRKANIVAQGHEDGTPKDEVNLNKETNANMFPETQADADADLEAAEKPTAPHVGINPSDFPDGGFEAWLVVAGAWCALFSSFGWINCIGIFQEYYERETLRNLSPSTISWIPSLETFMMFAGGPVFGKVSDSYGVKWLLLVGTFCHVFGLMMTSLSTKYYQFILAQGILSALGASAIFYSAMASVPTWFFHNRAAALGVMTSGSSLAGVVLPIMVVKLIPKIGFPWTMRAVAFLLLGMLTIANLTLKSRLKPKPKPLIIMEFVRPLKEPAFLAIVIGSFLFFFGMFLPFTYVILQAQKDGMSINLSNYLVPILNAASIFGRIIPGIVADRIGRFNVMVITCFFSGIIVLALWLPSKGSVPIIIFSALYGVGSGAFVSLAPSLIAQISDIRQIGVRNGTLFAIVSVGALTGSPVGGALLTHDKGDFTSLQVFCGCCLLAGSTGFLVSRWVQCGFAWKKI